MDNILNNSYNFFFTLFLTLNVSNDLSSYAKWILLAFIIFELIVTFVLYYQKKLNEYAHVLIDIFIGMLIAYITSIVCSRIALI
jgi:hypothetical protein